MIWACSMIEVTALLPRVALVTGASGAIGGAIAVALAERGAELCVVGRDEVRLTATVEAIRTHGTKVVPFVTDLTSQERVKELAEDVDRVLGGLDILVHAAGIYEKGDLGRSSIHVLDDLYRVNLRAPYQLTQLLLPKIAERRGDVVFVNSTQGLSAGEGIGQYAATQHAMKAVADSLRAEVNAVGIRVTTLHLGRTESEMQERIFAAEERPYTPETLVQPEDVAVIVVAAVTLPRRAQVTTITIWPTVKV